MLTRKIFEEQLEKTIDKYYDSTKDLVYQAKGFRFCQGLPVCALVDYYDIDLILESGVCRGMSTEIFCSYTKSDGVHVIGIDKDVYSADKEIPFEQGIFNSTGKRLGPQYPNLKLIHGDSSIVMPEILKENTHLNIAIVIDGPKFESALDLARSCMQYENVKFFAFDDAAKETDYHFVDRLDSCFFYTDETWYYDKYGWLDDVKHESYSELEKDPVWPTKTLEALLEKRRSSNYPQGGGLGIAINGKFEKTNQNYLTGPIAKKDWPTIPDKYRR